MNVKATGVIHAITPTTSKGENGYLVRDLLLDVSDHPDYKNIIRIQFSQQNTGLLDFFTEGQSVEVRFRIRGRYWDPRDGREPQYFNSLEAWQIRPNEDINSSPSFANHEPSPHAHAPTTGGQDPATKGIPVEVSGSDAESKLPF